MTDVQKPGSIVHIEVQSNDPTASARFFKSVFGWKIREYPQMNYTMWNAASGPGGGFTVPHAGMGPGTLNHILSSSIALAQKKILAAGGIMIVEKTAIAEMGWFAMFRDPGGAVLALYEELPHAHPHAKPAKKTARKAKAKAPKRKARR